MLSPISWLFRKLPRREAGRGGFIAERQWRFVYLSFSLPEAFVSLDTIKVSLIRCSAAARCYLPSCSTARSPPILVECCVEKPHGSAARDM